MTLRHTGAVQAPFELSRNGSLESSQLVKLRTAVVVLGDDDDAFFGEVMKLVRWIDAATAAYKFRILSRSRPGRANAMNILEENIESNEIEGVLEDEIALHWRAARVTAPLAVQKAMRQRNAHVFIGMPKRILPDAPIDFSHVKQEIGREFLSNPGVRFATKGFSSHFIKRGKVAWRERQWRGR